MNIYEYICKYTHINSFSTSVCVMYMFLFICKISHSFSLSLSLSISLSIYIFTLLNMCLQHYSFTHFFRHPFLLRACESILDASPVRFCRG